MATVNKDFRIKSGLVVEGANATVNGDNVVTATATQTLTNKTIGAGGLTFTSGGTSQSIYADGNDFTIYGHNNLYLNTNNSNIVLQPDGNAYVWSEVIATQDWVVGQGYLTSFSETDPVFTASAAYGITSTDINNWSSAYGWGNHASAGYLTSFTETDPVFVASDAYGITATDISNWNSAYGWGDHAGAGYLTSSSLDAYLPNSGNNTYTGDLQFFPSDNSGPFAGYADIQYKGDGDANGAEGLYITANRGWISDPPGHPQTGGKMYVSAYDAIDITAQHGNILLWTPNGGGYLNDELIATQDWVGTLGYITSESDPIFTASAAYGISSTDINNWSSAYGWGNHASAGYLTSAVESIANTDGNIAFSASSGSVTANLATDVEISGDLVVQGDLTVNGDVTTINTATLAVEDNLVVLNTNVTGTPTLDAGIEVERGDYTNAKVFWKEASNAWYLATPGDSSGAATEAEIATVGNVTLADAALISANSTSSTVYSWAGATYSTAKFTIQMKQGSDIHVLEILAAIAGSSVYVTEYAEIISNTALGETDVTYDGTTAVLTVTPASGTVTTKIVAQLIEA